MGESVAQQIQQTKHRINFNRAKNSILNCLVMTSFQLSGLLSSLIDSIPVTAMMIKIVLLIAEDESIKLPIQPLVWAVAFGPCLGGTSRNEVEQKRETII